MPKKKKPDLPESDLSGKTFKAVVVTWVDAVGHDSVQYPPFPIMTIGYFIGDHDDHIVIAAEVCADGEKRSFITIPKSLIRHAQLLTVKVPKLVLEYRKEHINY